MCVRKYLVTAVPAFNVCCMLFSSDCYAQNPRQHPRYADLLYLSYLINYILGYKNIYIYIYTHIYCKCDLVVLCPRPICSLLPRLFVATLPQRKVVSAATHVHQGGVLAQACRHSWWFPGHLLVLQCFNGMEQPRSTKPNHVILKTLLVGPALAMSSLPVQLWYEAEFGQRRE